MDGARPRCVPAPVLMRTLIVSLILSLPAAAQFSPYISSVSPIIGPTSGGTTVTIRGLNLIHEHCALQICEPARVFVGAKEAQIVSAKPDEVVFVTPPHSAGRFDITFFRDIEHTRAIARDAFIYRVIFERLLVPVVFSDDLPGLNGSVWRTELSGFNASAPNFVVPNPDEAPCTYLDQRCPWFVDRNRSFVPRVPTDGHVPGRLLYIAGPGDPSRLSLDVRVRDVSRESESHGTELPSVLENDAFGPDEVIGLPNVPIGPLYRQKLRVYDLEGARGRAVTVRIEALGRETVTRALTTTSEPSGDFPRHPGYAELDLDRIPELAGAARVDVHISTGWEGKWWAFISVTNNVTQQITTVTP